LSRSLERLCRNFVRSKKASRHGEASLVLRSSPANRAGFALLNRRLAQALGRLRLRLRLARWRRRVSGCRGLLGWLLLRSSAAGGAAHAALSLGRLAAFRSGQRLRRSQLLQVILQEADLHASAACALGAAFGGLSRHVADAQHAHAI